MKLPFLPPRARDAHKGDFGKILIIGGSRAMPGAAALAATAALESGAGLVKVAAPQSAIPAIAAHFPCYTFLPCPENEEGGLSAGAASLILNETEQADVLALGPGLTTHPETAAAALKIIESAERPLVIDADGLNIAASDISLLAVRNALTVLTPHPGEFARLYGQKPPQDGAGREEAAVRLAEKTRSIVVLKGRGSVVTDGRVTHRVATGNPGMATAGSGDVLTGMIAAFLAVLPTGLEAVVLAAHLHGLAGDLAAEEVGETSLTACDLLAYLPAAIRKHQSKGTP